MAELTPRQQQIADLIQEGKDPKQIAKQLRISRNAVYQQLRRIREGGGASRSSGRQSARRTRPPRAIDRNVPQPKITPLQAIRARKTEIETELRESRHNVEQAERVWKQAHDAHGKLGQRHDEELRNLTTAEAALTGKSHGGRRVRSTSSRRRTRRQPARNSQPGRKRAPQAQEAAQASS